MQKMTVYLKKTDSVSQVDISGSKQDYSNKVFVFLRLTVALVFV